MCTFSEDQSKSAGRENMLYRLVAIQVLGGERVASSLRLIFRKDDN